MNKQWKYLVIEAKTGIWGSFKAETLQEELDKHGRLGWELVNVVHATPTLSSPTLIFKKSA
ncbi:DUF4177 domain-containing protein [Flavobacterium sp. MXW15]|uniref:DUF4177 domain-containing protein n=1 Tax=Xanthomonas chitinilytica TaxID=2989819 RepID=A0ABT3JVF5_9XANT|nr:DUF4177 domain-containing protein [Xanthomonas sp. H13-6]MCW4454905.1 DUF4177 domain-containing protein [Flavobacterium sp. MXW15]MCW4472467.1 DUF4177 domain-containing protein [Xanthomonas sp. H13-6]